jgi:hypothetical protein
MFVQRFTKIKDSLGITDELAEQNANFKTSQQRLLSRVKTTLRICESAEHWSQPPPNTSIRFSQDMEQLTMVHRPRDPINLAALRHGVEGNFVVNNATAHVSQASPARSS